MGSDVLLQKSTRLGSSILTLSKNDKSAGSFLTIPFLELTSLNSGMRISRVSLAASFLASFFELPNPRPYSMPLTIVVALKEIQSKRIVYLNKIHIT